MPRGSNPEKIAARLVSTWRHALLSFACSDCFAFPRVSKATTYAFADYLRDFSKSYPNAAEFAQREAAFSAAMAKIREHNSAEGSSFTMGVSEHTDKLPEEWRKITTGRNAGLAADLAATRRMAACSPLAGAADGPLTTYQHLGPKT